MRPAGVEPATPWFEAKYSSPGQAPFIENTESLPAKWSPRPFRPLRYGLIVFLGGLLTF